MNCEVIIGHKSRTNVSTMLCGLCHLYMNPELHARTFTLLETEVNPNVRKDTGHQGMDLWCILVLVVLKQGLTATMTN